MPDAIKQQLDVQISGDLWWNGFNPDIALTNTSSSTVDNWSWSTALTSSTEALGISSITLDDDSYTLSGTD